MGLLDVFGSGPDDPRRVGMEGLIAGLLSRNAAGGLLAGSQGIRQARKQQADEAMKRQLFDAQLAETQAQAQERQQRMKMALDAQARQDRFLNGDDPVSPGAFSAPADGRGPTMPATQGAGGLIAQARAMGIPEKAIQADVVFNNGKGISDMLFKRGSPDMQVTNGYAYDKNRLGAGFMPQLNTSQDGKTSMVTIDPRTGMPTVSAPNGALNTFAGYQNVQEGTRANYDPVTVQPAGQAPQMTTRGALVRSPQVQGTQIPPAVQAARDADRNQIINDELTKAKAELAQALRNNDQSAAARAQGDIAALTRELGGKGATVGMPLASKEDELRAQKGVEGDAAANAARSKDVVTAKKFLSIADQAEQLLKSGPTASGFGSMMDRGAAFFGKSTDGAVAAQQLKALGGWLVANVPRMEGPQSNFDVANYQIQAADVANDSLPVERRMAALKSIKEMMGRTVSPEGTWEPNGKSSTMSNGWSATLKK